VALSPVDDEEAVAERLGGRGGRGWFCAFGSLEEMEDEWAWLELDVDVEEGPRGGGLLLLLSELEYDADDCAAGLLAQLAVAGRAGAGSFCAAAAAEEEVLDGCSFHACLRSLISALSVPLNLAAACKFASPRAVLPTVDEPGCVLLSTSSPAS